MGVTIADVVTGASVAAGGVVVTVGVGVADVVVGGGAGTVTVTVTVDGGAGGRAGGIANGGAMGAGSADSGATGAAAMGAGTLTCGPIGWAGGIAAADADGTTEEVVAGVEVLIDAVTSVGATFDPKIETAKTTITASAAVAPRTASTFTRLDWDVSIVSSTL